MAKDKDILVVAEHRGGQLVPATVEAVAAGQEMARQTQAEVAATVLEAASGAAAGALARFQLAKVIRAHDETLASYSPSGYTQALAQVIDRLRPGYVLFPHTYQTRDFVPRLATRLGRGFISDVTSLRLEQDRWIASRPMFQGRLAADVSLSGDVPHLISVQAGAFRAERAEKGAAPAPVEEEAAHLQPGTVRMEPPFQEAKQAVDLTQAAIIVAAGRGIKEAKNLQLVRQLAEALGGELAASRPICDSGWLPMDRQVGSSGQTVAPKLYLAVGISGAIQHLVGMKGSRSVVAINKDPEAPIFEIADFGIVGDLFEVVPALIAAIQKAKAAS